MSKELGEKVCSETGLSYQVECPKDVDGTNGGSLVIMLHGYGGDSSAMAVFAKCFRSKARIIVFPQAPISASNGGYSWWEVPSPVTTPAKDRKTRPEQIGAATKLVEAFVSAVEDRYFVDSSRTCLVGFSQGAMIAGTLPLGFPGRYRGAALLSGLIPSAVFEDEPVRFIAQHLLENSPGVALPPYFIFHGQQDPVVAFERAEYTRDNLTRLGAEVTFVADESKHKVSVTGMNMLTEWFNDIQAIGR